MPSRRDGLCCACRLQPAAPTRSYCAPCGQARDRAYRLTHPRRAPERPLRARKPRQPRPAVRAGLLVRADCLPPVVGTVERVDVGRRLAWVAGVCFGWGELKEVR